MNYLMLPSAALVCFLMGCTHDHGTESDHAHDAAGDHVEHVEQSLEALDYTLYTDKTELFVEFKPLIVGTESRFAAHFTALGDLFKAVGKGEVKLSLIGEGTIQSITAEEPEVPGIFRLRMTPQQAGAFDLVFTVQTPEYRDTISINNVQVFPDVSEAMRHFPATGQTNGNDITYLKEQAWKVEFANAPARVRPFGEVIKTSGQLLPAPGDEVVLSAQISGLVSFTENDYVVGTEVAKGTTLFHIRSNDVVRSTINAALTQAQNDLAVAEKNYARAGDLVEDRIISQREFLEAELRLENARARVTDVSVSKSFNQSRQRVATPLRGFLKEIAVENGQFVEAGQPLATISRNERLLLRVDVAQGHFPDLGSFTEANFILPGGKTVYNTQDLRGKVISFGKSAGVGSPFVPLFFEIDNAAKIIPGSVVEVFLISRPRPALTIPTSALLENMGIFYAYVQTAGESFEKRELALGASDGINVVVRSGIAEGERVVTQGGYQIKLSTASGTLPAHGHEH